MKLSDFMHANNLNDADMADLIGRHRVSVTRYRNGRVRPDWSALAAIERATNGAVTASDFMPSDQETAA